MCVTQQQVPSGRDYYQLCHLYTLTTRKWLQWLKLFSGGHHIGMNKQLQYTQIVHDKN